MYKLIIEDDEGKTTAVPLIRNEIVVGRAEDNTIRLTERNVSRRHARLWLEDGHIYIEDLKSYNGLWVNGDRVEGELEINPGDLLEIGDYHLTIQDDRDADQEAHPSLPPKGQVSTPPAGVPALQGDGPPARLVVLNTQFAKKEFGLSQEEVHIGRTEEDNEIAIDHPSVSRQHAKITRAGGAYQISDMESANGVRVNGEDYSVCDLRWGDIIELGHVRLRFVAPVESKNVQVNIQPDESMQVGAVTHEGSMQRTTIMLAGGGIVLILLFGVMWMLLSKPENNKPTPKRPSAKKSGEPDSLRIAMNKTLRRAKKAFKENDYEQSLNILRGLLKIQGDWKEALLLKKYALYEKSNRDIMRQALAFKADKKYVDAYREFDKVKNDSRYHDKAQQERKRLFNDLWEGVQKAVTEKRFDEALQLNATLMDMEGANKKVQEMHKQIQLMQIEDQKEKDLAKKLKTKRPKRRRVRRIRKRNLIRRPVPRKGASKMPPRKSTKKAPISCRGFYTKSQFRSLRRCAKRALKQNPNRAIAYFYYGHALSELGHCSNAKSKKYKPNWCFEAIKYYEEYVKRKPKGKLTRRLKKIIANAKGLGKPAPR